MGKNGRPSNASAAQRIFSVTRSVAEHALEQAELVRSIAERLDVHPRVVRSDLMVIAKGAAPVRTPLVSAALAGELEKADSLDALLSVEKRIGVEVMKGRLAAGDARILLEAAREVRQILKAKAKERAAGDGEELGATEATAESADWLVRD